MKGSRPCQDINRIAVSLVFDTFRDILSGDLAGEDDKDVRVVKRGTSEFVVRYSSMDAIT